MTQPSDASPARTSADHRACLPPTLRPNEPFAVWAPNAGDVTLVLNDERHVMWPHRGGWFAASVHASPGDRYGFELVAHGATEPTPVLPDPRSRRQPDGIHGLSAIPEPLSWDDDTWTGRELAQEVLYELHVGTFTPSGTFDGVIERLDSLAELGVTGIELMPCTPFGGTRNWGYDGVGWFAVHEPYGGPAGLARLVNAAHQRGLSVVMDVVYNHFGPDGNYLPFFGPYLANGTNEWGDVVNFSEAQSDEVRRYCLDAARMWLEDYRIDGLRLDAVHAYDDRGAYSLMEQLQAVAEDVSQRTGRAKYLIAESDLNDPKLINPQGYNLAGQWVDDIHHSLHTLTSGEDHAYFADYAAAGTAGLAKSLGGMYFFQGDYSSFRLRTHGRPLPQGVAPQRGVTYTTTHDQTGNRQKGDRPSQYLTPAQLRLRAATVLLSPYVPMLFMGEEFAATTPFPFFCSHENHALNEATRQGRLEEFSSHGWDTEDMLLPDAPATFEQARLRWDDADASMLATYRELIETRKRHRLCEIGYEDFTVDHGEHWVRMRYPTLTFVGNYSPTPITVGEIQLGPWEYAVMESQASTR